MNRRIAGIFLALLLAAAPQAARAQQNSLVGLWSAPLPDRNGQTWAMLFWRFGADGSYQQQFVLPAGLSYYTGRYTMAPDGAAFEYTLTDYEPKQSCGGPVCLPMPPLAPLGQKFTVPIRFLNPGLFLVDDAGGTLRFVRQP